MNAANWRRAGAATLLGLACAGAGAADADDDALGLQPELSPEAERAPSGGGTQVFLEGEIGRADQRDDRGPRTVSRAAVDLRSSFRPTPSTRVVLSARADDGAPSDPRIHGTVFSFREAYVGWQSEQATQAVELGRINLREGPGYGYNPTDFFRDNALRTISTVNPFSLREQRIGSVMLRAQQLWAGGSLAVVYSPRLALGGRSDEGFSFDLGSTNARDRGTVSLSSRFSEKVSTQVTVYKEAGSSARFGASLTALVSDAAVAHAEWTYSREPELLARALQTPDDKITRQRAVAGLTYTTTSNLSAAVEYQYNGFALDRSNWRFLGTSAGLPAQGAYFQEAVALQDSPARHAVLLYAVQRDLYIKKLDITALVLLNRMDHSALLWADLRYRMDKFDVALRLQHNGGTSGSEFGLTAIRNSASILGVAYF